AGSVQEDMKEEKDAELEWVGEYRSDVEGILQVLKVRLLADELFFDYTIAAGDSSVCYSSEGRAILKVGDLEWDDDNEGVAYAVDEYVHDSVCYMAIRIDAETRKCARIITDDDRALECMGEDASPMRLVRQYNVTK
ncbi:MAG: hypothetical protein J5641_07620, partial [Bacteroidales bacterium]|nr:hypothetical protein [Bacteroidales bacterium]